MNNILILDGYNLFYRARYSGMNRGEYSVIFNFFRGLRPLIEKFDPDFTYLVLEGMPKKRLEIDPNYKGQREYKDDDNFSFQRKEIVRILNEYFPIQLVRHADYECDDIIGYLAKKHEDKSVTIISSDTDFIQCINENVNLYNPVSKKNIEKPEYDYVLWKSLKGDDSDNIAGFPGIGAKKAEKMARNESELEKFLLKEGRKEKLESNLEMIRLHELGEDENSITYYDMLLQPKWEHLKKEFETFEFKSMVAKESSWNKYINTFNKLFIGEKNVNREST